MLNLKKLIASVSAVALVLTSVATTAFAGSYTDVAEDSAQDPGDDERDDHDDAGLTALLEHEQHERDEDPDECGVSQRGEQGHDLRQTIDANRLHTEQKRAFHKTSKTNQAFT